MWDGGRGHGLEWCWKMNFMGNDFLLWKYCMNEFFSNENLELWSQCALMSSLQFSIGSVEMSSKFSVKNFSDNQDTLDNAHEALLGYIGVAIWWTISLSVLFYAKHGIQGMLVMFIFNIAIVYWIYDSYIDAFRQAAEKYKLKMPTKSFF